MSDQATEEWRDVVGYEGHYMVSSFGRVKSLKKGRERIMKLQTVAHGYLQVGLFLNGKTAHLVHLLVARAFIGERPEGFQINHRNRNKQLNTPENLEYVTHVENIHHRFFVEKDGDESEYGRLVRLYNELYPYTPSTPESKEQS